MKLIHRTGKLLPILICLSVLLCLPGLPYLSSLPGLSGLQSGVAAAQDLPVPFQELLAADLQLPLYHEAWYHPLGRNPVVDAVLGDPLYFPTYGRQVSGSLRRAAERNSVERVLFAAQRGGAIPGEDVDFRGWLREAGLDKVEIPGLIAEVGAMDGRTIGRAWQLFLLARQIAENELNKLTPAEKDSLVTNPESYFFGDDPSGEYAFFTDDTTYQLEVFRLASRLDLSRMAKAGLCLAFAADLLQGRVRDLGRYTGDFEHTVGPDDFPGGRHSGVKLLIAGAGDDIHKNDCDFLIDTGGNDIYLNNAGGTRGTFPAALLLDLAGDDRYQGDFGVQGAGFCGVGGLIDYAGDDFYQAVNFSQGAAWFGAGLLADLKGDDEYRADYFVQSAAAYGSALLWDGAGDDTYEATGLAQAASTTLGVAFLVESGGDDRFRCGHFSDTFWTRAIGIGQGGAVGMRDYPWRDRPTFYGGVAFLDDAAGNDDFYSPVFCQGGAYVLGAGVLVNSGGDDRYINQSDGLGGVVHLAAGLMIKDGGDDTYEGAWGSSGIGGDRGVGIFIDTGGNDRHLGGAHNIGSARKPKAVGLFVDLAGDDSYVFDGESCGRVQRPRDPEGWPRALFMDLGGRDQYPSDSALDRGDNLTWHFEGHGTGVDTTLTRSGLAAKFFDALPASPPVEIPFDPLADWQGNMHQRALGSVITTDSTAITGSDSPPVHDLDLEQDRALELLDQLSAAGFDRRRWLYEQLDLIRYQVGREGFAPVLLTMLQDLEFAPADQLAYAALWAEVDTLPGAVAAVARPLARDWVVSSYARRLLIRMVGSCATLEATTPPATSETGSIESQGGTTGSPEQQFQAGSTPVSPGRQILINRLAVDPDPLCRRTAAFALGRLGGASALAALTNAVADTSTVVRTSVCSGLRDSGEPGALAVVRPLLTDDNLFVRRHAAVTAISLGHKPAVGILLESMRIPSLDTGENYGQNLFTTLAEYVGEDVLDANGLDIDKWLTWWRKAERSFDLQGAIDRNR